MIAIIFLILWLPDQPVPLARFIATYEDAKTCNEYISNAKLELEVKRQLACIELTAPLDTQIKE